MEKAAITVAPRYTQAFDAPAAFVEATIDRTTAR
jgi:hypothetical protein